jgi:hypothetical protein
MDRLSTRRVLLSSACAPWRPQDTSPSVGTDVTGERSRLASGPFHLDTSEPGVIERDVGRCESSPARDTGIVNASMHVICRAFASTRLGNVDSPSPIAATV